MTEDQTMETALAIVAGKEGDDKLVAGTPWNVGMARTLCRTVAPGLTPDEFRLFGMRCEATGLDPFQGQIHAVVRGRDEDRKLCIQTGIDGFRLTAHRTGDCQGISDVSFTYREGDTDQLKPIAATCTVYRWVHGQRCEFPATVRFAEYDPGGKQGFMWKQKPHVMLGKCAEAAAIRKGFPSDLSAMYLPEEMAQADAPAETETLQEKLAAKKAAAPKSKLQDKAVDAETVDDGPPLPPDPDDPFRGKAATAAASKSARKEPPPMDELETVLAACRDMIEAMPEADQADHMETLSGVDTADHARDYLALLKSNR